VFTIKGYIVHGNHVVESLGQVFDMQCYKLHNIYYKYLTIFCNQTVDFQLLNFRQWGMAFDPPRGFAMTNIWKFAPESGKERSLLTIIILHSLGREPKSGYTLLKEIAGKTQGSWIPNKGTLYPVLKSLEQERLIKLKEIGKRSKRVYELTDAGEETLAGLKGNKGESEDRVAFFKRMHLEIFGEENISLINLLMDIRFYVETLHEERKERAAEILKAAFAEIKRIKAGISEGSKE